MFFTSIFCGSLFCGSAVHILKDVIADSRMQSAIRGDRIRFCSPFQGQIKAGFSLRAVGWAWILYSWGGVSLYRLPSSRLTSQGRGGLS